MPILPTPPATSRTTWRSGSAFWSSSRKREPASLDRIEGIEPRAEYATRLAVREAAAERLTRRSDRIGNTRLAVAVAAIPLIVLAARGLLPEWWLLVPLAAFVGLVLVHARIRRAADRGEAAAEHYRDGLARIDDTWAGRGVGGEELAPAAHPYSDDLDLFGDASMFERLCRARTGLGRERLAAYLLEPAGVDSARARQAAVRDLLPRLDLREDLAIVDPAGESLDRATLQSWIDSPAAFTDGQRLGARALPAVGLLLLVAWILGAGFPVPLIWLSVFAVQNVLAWRLRGATGRTLAGAEDPERELVLAGALFDRMESELFEAELLTGHISHLVEPDRATSSIVRLERRVRAAEARENLFFVPFSLLMMWGTNTAIVIDRWRLAARPRVMGWLEAVGELEALVSLSAYGFENPGDSFPDLETAPPRFQADGLAHPLLPIRQAVRNDVRLDASSRLLVLSGSNMSGKSTLLRAIGVNAVLALAGAPVRAARLAISSLRIGASMRVRDSLQEGVSGFYAELQKLDAIAKLADTPPPTLFLVDEMLHGTNSHDRRIGAEAVLRRFLDAGAIGLVTTHDLALTELPERIGKTVENIHFTDRVVHGQLEFDYKLRPGPVPGGNALQLLRSFGFEVEDQPTS